MSIKKNYIYNLLYQISAVLLPLITMPYVARILDADGIGINSYTNANAQYFILLGTLGISMYATKKIATVRDNKNMLKQNFWEILFIQIMGCLGAYILFLIVLGTNEGLGIYYFLQGFFIIGSAIDLSWYFIGIENFKNASIRNFFVKITSVVFIFIFVKTKEDLWKYIAINSITMLIGQIAMWFYISKDLLVLRGITKFNPFKHLKAIISLFIPQLAIQFYMVLDKTMTGKLANTIEVAYYDQSQKLIRVLLAIITSLGMVMLPRIASLYSKEAFNEVKDYLRKAFIVSNFLSIPIALGIMAISNRFIPMFFGQKYIRIVPLTIISSLMIIFVGIGNVFGTQYLLAVGKNKQYTASVIIGAIINVSLNFILIPKMLAMGAVISTLIAEVIIALIQLFFSRKIINYFWLKSVYKYWISGLIMFICVEFIDKIHGNDIIILLSQIIVGCIIYFTLLLLFKDDFISSIFKNIKSKIIT